eukprot:304718-Pelagomonas_calceolata.AAC.1
MAGQEEGAQGACDAWHSCGEHCKPLPWRVCQRLAPKKSAKAGAAVAEQLSGESSPQGSFPS